MGRGFDCDHPDHGKMHLSGDDDADLLAKAQQHRDQYHTELTDEQLKELISSSAYDE